MLERLSVRGFKSLTNVGDLALPRMAVLFGPNASGKSNFLDAVQALSRIGTCRTLSDALQDPIRGHPIEAFSFPPGGLPELLRQPSAEFTLDAVIRAGAARYRYRVSVQTEPRSGALTIADEYLAALTQSDSPKGEARIERVGNKLRVRRSGKPARPREEPLGLNYALLSDPRLSGQLYAGLERCRAELSKWRTYYLDPRVSMRRASTPAEVQDIGVLGEHIAPFLYRLKTEKPKHFQAVIRTLRTLIPNVGGVDVELDEKRGTLDISVEQSGIHYPSRVVSEGTLRVLAMCAIVVNPWSGPLLAFEEPENGVHPRRLELIADLLGSLVEQKNRQLLVTTHSPVFCAEIVKKAQASPENTGLFVARQADEGTSITPFVDAGPLLRDTEIAEALSHSREDGVFEGLLMLGLLDE